MIRVVAPSRLHCGLFNVPEQNRRAAGERAFGGVGMMIDAPGVVVVAEPAESWQFEGPLASRAQVFAHRFVATLPEAQRRPFRVLVERAPAEHTGLGVGTQLGLAVAKALAVALGDSHALSVALASRIGRGERSSVGVYGFDTGGLLAEVGKLPGEALSPVVESVQLPDEWRAVVFTPSLPAEWHGDRERGAFAAATGSDADFLRALAETAILPAARAGDILALGEALHEFNRRAGEPFAAVQGGTYASPAIAELIADVRVRSEGSEPEFVGADRVRARSGPGHGAGVGAALSVARAGVRRARVEGARGSGVNRGWGITS